MESAFADYARADARSQKINVTMDVEMTKIREKFADELTKLTDVKSQIVELCQWIDNNKDKVTHRQINIFSKYSGERYKKNQYKATIKY
jgi:hypothetical protein